MISVRNLSAKRGRKIVIQNISLEFNGGVIGLVAPNGSGKTTLLESLTKPWDKRASGEVLLDGTRPAPKTWKQSVYYLPSANEVLEPSLTGRQHTELAKELWNSNAKVEEIAASCGSSDILDIPAHKCSQGMKQLVAITVAMCTGARLLLLDEPLSALDPTNTNQVATALKRYTMRGRTVLMSTHNLANVDTSCERVYYLHSGALIPSSKNKGTPSSCLKEYQDIFEKGGLG